MTTLPEHLFRFISRRKSLLFTASHEVQLGLENGGNKSEVPNTIASKRSKENKLHTGPTFNRNFICCAQLSVIAKAGIFARAVIAVSLKQLHGND